jgi:hypothetical protein
LLAGHDPRKLGVPQPFKLADLLSERAARWVTAELSTLVPYALPQAWARAFRLEGLRYAVRHSISRWRESYALFHAAGARRGWKRGRRIAHGPQHRAQLRERCGIELFDVPSEDALTFPP